MDGHADHHAVSDTAAHLRGSHVLLPDVHAVGAAGDGDVHIVVDEERHAVTPAQSGNFLRLREKRLLVQLLFAELDAGHAAAQGGLYLLTEALLADPGAVRDGVEQHIFFIAFHSLRLSPALPG